MISMTHEDLAQVDEALRTIGKRVRNTRPGCWTFRSTDHGSRRVRATIQQEWLCLEAALPRRRKSVLPEELTFWLQRNSSLQGGARFALQEDLRQVTLLAEISLEEDSEHLPQRLAAACHGFGQALSDSTESSLREEGNDADTSSPLGDLCREAGWAFNERSGGRVAVPLRGDDRFEQAVLEINESGAVQAYVELGSATSASVPARIATSVLLLRAARWLRLARPIARSEDGTTVFAWQGVIHPPLAAGDLSNMLAALSVACQVSNREVRSLQEESIARSFLELQGATSLLFPSEMNEQERNQNDCHD